MYRLGMSYRLLKASVFTNVLKHTNFRMFSSTTTYPFMLIDHLISSFDSEDTVPDSKWSHARICSFSKNVIVTGERSITIGDRDLEDEVRDAMISPFSRNRSLRFDTRLSDDDIVIHHQVRSYLPPLPQGSKIQNIAMSSLPHRDKDWVVGVKLLGSQISLCRPFGNRKWINIETMPLCISPFSSLMFSKKDNKFYVPSSGGSYLFSLDPHYKEKDKPELFQIYFDELPKSVVPKLEQLILCSGTDHLVESPTGQLFLVKWYSKNITRENTMRSVKHKTHRTVKFMVFREEEVGNQYYKQKKMIYTEDIGDLCIFLGHSEALCIPASSSPGLKPNCIYFVGHNFGVYDLTTDNCTTFLTTKGHGPESDDLYLLSSSGFPYWPLPVPLY